MAQLVGACTREWIGRYPSTYQCRNVVGGCLGMDQLRSGLLFDGLGVKVLPPACMCL